MSPLPSMPPPAPPLPPPPTSRAIARPATRLIAPPHLQPPLSTPPSPPPPPPPSPLPQGSGLTQASAPHSSLPILSSLIAPTPTCHAEERHHRRRPFLSCPHPQEEELPLAAARPRAAVWTSIPPPPPLLRPIPPVELSPRRLRQFTAHRTRRRRPSQLSCLRIVEAPPPLTMQPPAHTPRSRASSVSRLPRPSPAAKQSTLSPPWPSTRPAWAPPPPTCSPPVATRRSVHMRRMAPSACSTLRT
mmetsp:Transcript_66518/g.131882  ORF Transcript_66518/g.131882 Transcript_66518/m.131882 type:complete len:245 (+) Transcript_66518:252-986(+)